MNPPRCLTVPKEQETRAMSQRRAMGLQLDTFVRESCRSRVSSLGTVALRRPPNPSTTRTCWHGSVVGAGECVHQTEVIIPP